MNAKEIRDLVVRKLRGGVLQLFGSRQGSSLNDVIPPEIRGDNLYRLIEQFSARESLKHVLEIGSSSGGGSTEAFVRGLGRNPSKPNLYCIEVSGARFNVLSKTYADQLFVHCYNMSTLKVDEFPSESEVKSWYEAHPESKLRNWPVERVLEWLRQDVAYVRDSAVNAGAVERIKADHGIDHFDMVLIDGSEFAGARELEQVRGARIIILDDTQSFKCWDARDSLAADPSYELVTADPSLRNGYAVFKRA